MPITISGEPAELAQFLQAITASGDLADLINADASNARTRCSDDTINHASHGFGQFHEKQHFSANNQCREENGTVDSIHASQFVVSRSGSANTATSSSGMQRVGLLELLHYVSLKALSSIVVQ